MTTFNPGLMQEVSLTIPTLLETFEFDVEAYWTASSLRITADRGEVYTLTFSNHAPLVDARHVSQFRCSTRGPRG